VEGALRLVVLNDNRSGPGLENRWGWSLYIDHPVAGPVLFDADTEPNVICSNADKLGVNLSSLSLAILSHEHMDHYGGMPCPAARRPGLPVYVPPGLHLWAKGLGVELRFNRSGGWLGKWLYMTRPLKAGMIMEHALAVRVSGDRAVVVVGCSHPGVDRLVEQVVEAGLEPLLVIGGYHGPSRRQLDRLASMARYISPAHCSGDEAVEYVRREYPGRLVLVRTGSVLEVGPSGPRLLEDEA